MTLRDALAASLWEPWEGHPTGGHCLVCGDDSADLAVAAHDAADAILSDPAFRAALTEAVAEACRAEWPFHREGSTTYNGYVAVTMGPEWTVLDPALPSSLDYAAIVARMLGEEP